MKFALPSFRNPLRDPARRRAVLARSAAGILLVVFSAIYLQMNSLRSASERALVSREADIRAARAGGLDGLSTEELGRLQKASADFREGFTRIAEIPALLDSLSDEAKKSEVRMLAIRSDQPQTVPGEAGAPLEIDGNRLVRLPITMRLQGTSRSIGNFLRAVTQSSRRLFVVESWQMTATKPPAASGVECDITVSFFSNFAGDANG